VIETVSADILSGYVLGMMVWWSAAGIHYMFKAFKVTAGLDRD